MKEKKEVIVLTDDNMDHSNDNYNNNFKIATIREKTAVFLSNNNITTESVHIT